MDQMRRELTRLNGFGLTLVEYGQWWFLLYTYWSPGWYIDELERVQVAFESQSREIIWRRSQKRHRETYEGSLSCSWYEEEYLMDVVSRGDADQAGGIKLIGTFLENPGRRLHYLSRAFSNGNQFWPGKRMVAAEIPNTSHFYSRDRIMEASLPAIL